MLEEDKLLCERMKLNYSKKVNDFFASLIKEGFTDAELNAVPALFLPGWGELYSSSILKIAIVGKETLLWGNKHGDSLLTDINAFQTGKYSVDLSCERFREQGPAEWGNIFWQYATSAIAKVFELEKSNVLQKDSPILKSIAWFNSHAIETYQSNGVDHKNISPEKMDILQRLADQHGLSDFETFVRVFQPHVILYFYRDSHGQSKRNLVPGENCEFRRTWGENGDIEEYQMGETIILNLRHSSWMTRGNMTQDACANLILEVLASRGILGRLPSISSHHFDLYSMDAVTWRLWVEIVRGKAEQHPKCNNLELSRHLILMVARELRKTKSTMTAQTLVLILNEVIKFRNENWQYSPERRGPCTSVKLAYNYYLNNDQLEDATYIAEAFTKLDGEKAYE